MTIQLLLRNNFDLKKNLVLLVKIFSHYTMLTLIITKVSILLKYSGKRGV